MANDGETRLEFRVLGPLEVRAPTGEVSLGGGRPRALVADLLVHAGRVVPVDVLVDDLWGERPPATARHALQVYVSQLRSAFGAAGARGVLASRPPGYRLDVDPERVDAFRFECLLAAGREALAADDPAGAAATLREALALWRGPPLVDFRYEPFAQAEIVRLEELQRQAVEDRIQADLALGLDAELVAELETLAGAHPLRERLRGQLMLALYRSGRQGDALAAYRAGREALVEELGIEPGPDVRALEAAMLRQDDELLLSPAAPAARIGAGPRRRLVSLLAGVADTDAGASLDPEALDRALGRYFEAAAAAVARHGGTIERGLGGSFVAAFGVPVAHEDDALRAARAGMELQTAVTELNEALAGEVGARLECRIGLETGEVLTGRGADDGALVTGHVVGLVSRLQATAGAGQVVVGELAARLIAHAVRLDPLAGGATGFRLLEVSADAPGLGRRLDLPFVGRRLELQTLEDALGEALETPACRVLWLVGPAGIGKSRLARELARRAGDRATVLTGRCPPYGEGTALLPLRTVVEQASGDHDRDSILAAVGGPEDAPQVAERLAALLDDRGPPVPPAEVPPTFRRFLELLACRRPVVLVLDDLHWADPLLLDVIEQLAVRGSAQPLLVLCLSRDELHEQRPGLVDAAAVTLDGLSEPEMQLLLGGLLGGSTLPRDVPARLLETAEGNPLFLEELLALAVEQGGFDPDRSVPPTIQALLAARLDRFGPGERDLLAPAAVVGREFALSTLRDLLAPRLAASADRHLAALVRRGFLVPVPSAAAFEETFRFRHALMRDAAYRAAPKGERADLHERLAGVLERRATEPDELLGYHLEQAHRLLLELGPPDVRAEGLAEAAARRLGAAGLRASARGDTAGTVDLLRRSTALRPDAELLCELGVGLVAAGELDAAERALEAALTSAGDRRAELRARVELSGVRVLSEPGRLASELLAAAHEAVPIFEAAGDHRSLGRAWRLVTFVEGSIGCRYAAANEAAERALVHYRHSGWSASACLGDIAATLYYGPTPVADALRRCEELQVGADRGGAANILVFRAGLEAMRGRGALARELLAQARETFEELGQHAVLASTWGAVAGYVETVAGDLRGAEVVLRDSCEQLERMGDRSSLATRAAELADVLYRRESLDEAEHWSRASRRLAAADDVSAQFLWRAVAAKLLGRRGRLEEADVLAGEAVRLAEETDALNQRARVVLDLAEITARSGRAAESAGLLEHARALYALKGNVAAADEAGSRLAEAARS
jgi:DNA-binding SARP family transcriptional activator/tetratricopeptide (TPR) repeat protein